MTCNSSRCTSMYLTARLLTAGTVGKQGDIQWVFRHALIERSDEMLKQIWRRLSDVFFDRKPVRAHQDLSQARTQVVTGHLARSSSGLEQPTADAPKTPTENQKSKGLNGC